MLKESLGDPGKFVDTALTDGTAALAAKEHEPEEEDDDVGNFMFPFRRPS